MPKPSSPSQTNDARATEADVFTMGFSNRTWEDTIGILQGFSIERLVDIRTLPGSRRTPQFNLENLQEKLPESGIEYIHMKSLGGLRKPMKDSTENAAWRNDGFRGYADYMGTEEFAAAFSELLNYAERQRTAVMCAESLWWSCHRALISDALTFRGIEVIHILDEKQTKVHPYTAAASIIDGRLSYEAPDPQRPLPL